jgi:hypothetical protein
MRRRGVVTLGIVAVLCSVGHASGLSVFPCAGEGGECCEGAGPVALGWIDTGTGVYVNDRGILGNGVWVYAESNGVEGIQRGSESPIVAGDADPCRDDTLTFDTLIV